MESNASPVDPTNPAFYRLDDSSTLSMVSSDGEPHALLTMVAMASGFIVAVVVLLVLISLIDFSRNQPSHLLLAKKQRSMSLFSMFSKRQSVDITVVSPSHLENGTGKDPKPGDTAIQHQGYINERFRFDETVFTTGGKLSGISTISC